MNTPKIAVLGLGAMGSRIATNFINAGYGLTVWNRSTQPAANLSTKGATVAATPKQAAEQADIIFSVLTDDTASKAVWLEPETGAIHGLTSAKTAVEMSTLTTTYTQYLAKAIDQTSAAFLTAPVVGSRPQAEAQKLVCLVGGDTETTEKVKPILSSTSSAIHHVENNSHAMALKLAVNALFGIQVAAIAELLSALSQQGIAPSQAMDLLSQIPVMSPAAIGAGGAIAAQRYAPLFPINLVEKDFRYAQQLLKSERTVEPEQTTESKSQKMPITSAAHQLYQLALEKGYGSDNITGIAQLFSQIQPT